MKYIKRKQILALTIVAMVGVAGYLNYSYQQMRVTDELPTNATQKNLGELEMVDAQTAPNGIASAKTLREESKNRAIETLQEQLANTNMPESEKVKIAQSITQIGQNIALEGSVEGAIKLKGYTESCVYIASDVVNVYVMHSAQLTDTDIEKIRDVVSGMTKITNIKISQIK